MTVRRRCDVIAIIGCEDRKRILLVDRTRRTDHVRFSSRKVACSVQLCNAPVFLMELSQRGQYERFSSVKQIANVEYTKCDPAAIDFRSRKPPTRAFAVRTWHRVKTGSLYQGCAIAILDSDTHRFEKLRKRTDVEYDCDSRANSRIFITDRLARGSFHIGRVSR